MSRLVEQRSSHSTHRSCPAHKWSSSTYKDSAINESRGRDRKKSGDGKRPDPTPTSEKIKYFETILVAITGVINAITKLILALTALIGVLSYLHN